MRYFLDTDQDGHWFIVPKEHEAAWSAWCDLDPDDEAAWNAPEWAREVGGAPSCVTFTDPQL